MVILINPNNKKDLDLSSINEYIEIIKGILKNHNIYSESEFKKWLKDFELIISRM